MAKAKRTVRKKVTLRQEQSQSDSRFLGASYTPDGDLVVEGQDLGDGVRAVLGYFEYEWAWTIHAASIQALQNALGNPRDLLLALKKRFSNDDAENLGTFLAEHNITYETWSRMGD